MKPERIIVAECLSRAESYNARHALERQAADIAQIIERASLDGGAMIYNFAAIRLSREVGHASAA